MATATTGTPTYRRMAELAKTDEAIAARHDLYQHRVPEELYDVAREPDCLHNLLDSPERQAEVAKMRGIMDNWMTRTTDPMLEVFRKRGAPAAREAYVTAQEAEAAARRRPKKER